MGNEYLSIEDAQREFFRRANYVFSSSRTVSDKEENKIIKVALFYTNYVEALNKPAGEEHLIDKILSKKDINGGFNDLLNLCLIYSIQFNALVNHLVLTYVALQSFTTQLLKLPMEYFGYQFKDDYPTVIIRELRDIIFTELDNINEKELVANFRNINKNIIKEALNNSVDLLEATLYHFDFTNYKGLNLSKFKTIDSKHITELATLRETLIRPFENNKSRAKLFLDKNPHYLNKLSNDYLLYDKETDKFYFKELTESIKIAYTEKYLILNIDKKETVKQFEKVLNSLELLTQTEDILQKKENIKKLIDLIKNSNMNYHPFKIIGKALNMNKNEARNFCKAVIGQVNNQVFSREFEK